MVPKFFQPFDALYASMDASVGTTRVAFAIVLLSNVFVFAVAGVSPLQMIHSMSV